MNKILYEILKFVFYLSLGFFFTKFLISQERSSLSLWEDKNPYVSNPTIRMGDILTIRFIEPLKAEYQVEYKSDSDYKIKSNPDKNIIPEMKAFDGDQTIARRANAKSKTSGKIIGSMAVQVVGMDPGTGNLEIEGKREIRFENDRQILSIRGVVARQDIDSARVVPYEKIANLEINYLAHPTPRNIQNPDIGLKSTTNPDGSISYSSELSDLEKQEILLRYMKRLLGESGEEGSR